MNYVVMRHVNTEWWYVCNYVGVDHLLMTSRCAVMIFVHYVRDLNWVSATVRELSSGRTDDAPFCNGSRQKGSWPS